MGLEVLDRKLRMPLGALHVTDPRGAMALIFRLRPYLKGIDDLILVRINEFIMVAFIVRVRHSNT